MRMVASKPITYPQSDLMLPEFGAAETPNIAVDIVGDSYQKLHAPLINYRLSYQPQVTPDDGSNARCALSNW